MKRERELKEVLDRERLDQLVRKARPKQCQGGKGTWKDRPAQKGKHGGSAKS